MSANDPVASALASPLFVSAGVSEQERARLHRALDALLDQRAAWEQSNDIASNPSVLGGLLGLSSYTHLADKAAGADARDITGDAAKLLRDVLGVALRSATFQRAIRDDDGGKRVLSDWLRVLEPILETPASSILGSAPDKHLQLIEVLIGLSALRAGEVQPLFRPGDRGNKPANSYSLASVKLCALEWKEALCALGHSDGEANNLISQAFREQWDTIRKWRQPCASVLGDFVVSYRLGKARDVSHYQSSGRSALFGTPRTPEQDLQTAGAMYREERRRAADASKSKRARKSEPRTFPDK